MANSYCYALFVSETLGLNHAGWQAFGLPRKRPTVWGNTTGVDSRFKRRNCCAPTPRVKQISITPGATTVVVVVDI